jgi:hypothetical protein
MAERLVMVTCVHGLCEWLALASLAMRIADVSSGSFDRFVDLVEGHPLFSDLMAKRPTDSWVYWQDA